MKTILVLALLAFNAQAATINSGKQRTVAVITSPPGQLTALSAVSADPSKVQVTVNDNNTVTRKTLVAPTTSTQTIAVTYTDPCCTSFTETVVIPAKPFIQLGTDSAEF